MGSIYLTYPSTNKLSIPQKTVPLGEEMHWQSTSALTLMFCLKTKTSFNFIQPLLRPPSPAYPPTPRDKHQQGLNVAYLSEDLYRGKYTYGVKGVYWFLRDRFFPRYTAHRRPKPVFHSCKTLLSCTIKYLNQRSVSATSSIPDQPSPICSTPVGLLF